MNTYSYDKHHFALLTHYTDIGQLYPLIYSPKQDPCIVYIYETNQECSTRLIINASYDSDINLSAARMLILGPSRALVISQVLQKGNVHSRVVLYLLYPQAFKSIYFRYSPCRSLLFSPRFGPYHMPSGPYHTAV